MLINLVYFIGIRVILAGFGRKIGNLAFSQKCQKSTLRLILREIDPLLADLGQK